MNIVVCIKQVPASAVVTVDEKNHTINRTTVGAVINPYDLHALEEALSLREKHGGKITVLTMGPQQARAALREALAMGVDQAIHLCDKVFAGSDTWATSMALAYAIQKLGDIDLVICGKQAVDGDTAQVGPGIATHLDLPQATYVRSINSVHLDTRPKLLTVERLLEDGYELLEIDLPALITVVKEVNKPRMPNLKAAYESRQQEIILWDHLELGLCPDQLGLNGSPTRVIEVERVVTTKKAKLLEGKMSEIANLLVQELGLNNE